MLACNAAAGALYSGEVVVWDSSRIQDPVVAQTGLSADSHREPIYQVRTQYFSVSAKLCCILLDSYIIKNLTTAPLTF